MKFLYICVYLLRGLICICWKFLQSLKLHTLKVHIKLLSGSQYLYEMFDGNFLTEKQILSPLKLYVNKTSGEEMVLQQRQCTANMNLASRAFCDLLVSD